MAAKRKYRALVGLRYPTNPKAKRENWEWTRVVAGQVVDDIPAQSIDWLLKRGRIEIVDESGKGGDA